VSFLRLVKWTLNPPISCEMGCFLPIGFVLSLLMRLVAGIIRTGLFCPRGQSMSSIILFGSF